MILPLPPNCIHIYFGFIHDFPTESLIEILSEGEKEKANRFRKSQDQQLFIISRANLRRVLASYLHTDSSQIHFDLSPSGRPYIKGSSDVQFSVAHSNIIFVLAFVRNHSIGVDIEHLDRSIAIEGLSEILFSDQELEKFHQSEIELQHEHFINCWTRKEAVLKAKGIGFSLPLKQLEVSFLQNEKTEVVSTSWSEYERSEWFLKSLTLPGNYRGAVAVHGKIESVKIINMLGN